ncbi:unnamed protein product [Owenia fusiformis]|uniref:Uncharacterized protein n=1 Tax=Owenia fusiformis TaxID=6347 RepID=A0A8J1TTU1_OWEFU|nr:unnamed protein product [Owenia fusiformis]
MSLKLKLAEHTELVAEMPLVEKMTQHERLKHARKRRSQQMRRWANYDKLMDRESKKRKNANNNSTKNSRPKKRTTRLKFVNSIKLLEAAGRNDVDEVRSLLLDGVSPDVTNEDGLTALHQCCIDDLEEMLRLLIEFGANVNAKDSELWTPLHAAATCGHTHLCKYLIDKGAELLSVNADGNMPYDITEKEDTLNYIENEMAKRGVTQELIDETRLATEKQMLEDLQFLANNKGDLEFRDSSGATPLHIASANGFLQVVEFLLDQRVNVDAPDNDRWGPVHAAACWGHPVIMELLVQAGADIDATTKHGETPFDICEDPDFKERILEMKDEIEFKKSNNRGSGTIDSRTGVRKHPSRSDQSSITKHPSNASASVRRTSMREKGQISRKEAKDEGKYLASISIDNDLNEVPSPEPEENGFDDSTPPLPPTTEPPFDDQLEPAEVAMVTVDVAISQDNGLDTIERKNIVEKEFDQRHSLIKEDVPKTTEGSIYQKDKRPESSMSLKTAATTEPIKTKVKQSESVPDNIKLSSTPVPVSTSTPIAVTVPANTKKQEDKKENSNKENVEIKSSQNDSQPRDIVPTEEHLKTLEDAASPTQSSFTSQNSVTLAELKKQRSEVLRNSLRVSDPKSVTDALKQIDNEEKAKAANNSHNGTFAKPGEQPLKKFTAYNQSEIIGGNDKKNRCCIVM